MREVKHKLMLDGGVNECCLKTFALDFDALPTHVGGEILCQCGNLLRLERNERWAHLWKLVGSPLRAVQ